MISILIPIYNTPIEYINECFDSIDSQTFQDYEVVIVNDGSNEQITGFLKSLNKQKYSVYHMQRSGISAALNYGLTMCRYNLVARMDADDIMLPTRLEKQFKFFKYNDVDILGTQIELFGTPDSDNKITNHPEVIPRDMMAKSDWFLNHPSVMFNKTRIESLGGYNSDFDGLEDLELWCKALVCDFNIRNLQEVLLRHRRHSDNATVRNNMTEILKKINFIRNFYYQKLMTL